MNENSIRIESDYSTAVQIKKLLIKVFYSLIEELQRSENILIRWKAAGSVKLSLVRKRI